METFLVHTHPDISKINPFNGTFFKRCQERVYSVIDVVNLGHILTGPKPKSDYEYLSKWENGNKSEDIAAVVSFEVNLITNMKDWIVDSGSTITYVATKVHSLPTPW